MSGSTRKGERNKNDTWGEKELSKYISGSGKGTKESTSKKKTTSDAYGSYGSPKSQTKKASGTSSTKQSSSRAQREPDNPSAGLKESSKSGASKRMEDKGRDRSGGKSRRGQDSRGQSTDKQGARQGESSTKRSSKDGRRADDSKGSSSRGRGGGERDKSVGLKPERSRERESRETKDRHRSSDRDREHRKGDSKDSRTKDKERRERDQLSERERRKEKERAHKRSSGSTDRGGKDAGRKDKRREIVVQEEPPSEEEDMESGAGHIAGGNPPQEMVEVTDDVEDAYQYEDEEFEDFEYEADFDEVAEEETGSSQSEDEATPTKTSLEQKAAVSTNQPGQAQVDLLAIMEAIDAENMGVKSSSQTDVLEPSFENVEGTVIVKFTPNDNEQEMGYSEEGHEEVRRDWESSKLQSHSRKFVDFSHAQKNEASIKIAKKARKRAKELLSMIELDFISHDMFDLPPLSEYELYVKKFGADDTRQVSVQTGEDNETGETQTEPIPTEERWVQWPPEDLRGWGKGGDPGDQEEDEMSGVHGRRGMEGEDAIKLISFLKKAGQVCSVLLEENLTAVGQSPFHSTQSQFPFCSSTQRIQAVPPYISGRKVCWIDFSSTQSHLLLSAYSVPPVANKSAESGLRGKGLVCLWNTRDPLQPQMVLCCESSPTCCCFSPQKSSLAFAGNEDGSVVLWDLREPLSMHRPPAASTTPLSPRGREGETVARAPTFSTAGASQLDNHHAPIVAITPISTASSSSPSDIGGESHGSDGGGSHEMSGGLSFQLATLDRSGHLNIWVVVEITHPDPFGSEADLGLVPGGRVKLVKSTSINVTSPLGKTLEERSIRSFGSDQAFCMQFHPLDTSHVYVGTDTGRVCHVTRYGRRPIPRYYLPSVDHEDAVCDVLCLSFSLRQPDHFLAGCSDGSLKLYNTKTAKSLLSWNTFAAYGAAIIQVQWVESLPGVFLVQDSYNTLYMWDLLQNDSEPAFKETQKSRVSYCKVHSQSHTHKPPAPPILVIAYEDSSITLHQIKELTQGISEREEMLEDYLIKLT